MSFGFGFALPAYPLRGGGGNNPFNQNGPTLDLSFAGTVTDASNPNGYTLNTNFITPQYQIAAQYVIWETGVGLVDKTFSQIITFSRASGATWFNSAGNLIGVDFSTSSNTIGTGSKTFTLDATAGVNRSWATGDSVLIVDQANSANNMTGAVTSYTASTQTLVVNVTSTAGSGTITSWRIGNLMQRLDYDPATLAAQGLLIEEQRTNNVVWSESFRSVTLTVTSVSGTFANGETVTATGGGTGTYISANSTPTAFAIFNGTGTFTGTLTGGTSGATATISSVVGVYTPLFATVSADATTSPANTVTADKLQEDATTNAHYITQAFTPVNATTYTLSVFLKAAERGFAFVGFTSGSMATTFISVNLSTGAISTATGTPVASTTQAIGNGWYRVSISLTSTGTTQSVIDIRISTDGVWANRSYAGVAGNGIFIWGAQLEAGAFPTSYIPTTTTALTRSADVASVNTLSPWFNATEGTLFVDSTATYIVPATSFPTVAAFTDGANNNRLDVGYVTSGVASTASVVGGVLQAEIYPAISVSNRRTAFAYKVNDFAACSNGGAVGTDTSGALPTVDRMNIGSNATGNRLNGYLRRIVYYPRRLSNAELQSITS